MENEENQEQVSHRFPPPLGIAKGAIPTFPPRLPFIQIKKENNSTRSAAPTFRLILRLGHTGGGKERRSHIHWWISRRRDAPEKCDWRSAYQSKLIFAWVRQTRFSTAPPFENTCCIPHQPSGAARRQRNPQPPLKCCGRIAVNCPMAKYLARANTALSTAKRRKVQANIQRYRNRLYRQTPSPA